MCCLGSGDHRDLSQHRYQLISFILQMLKHMKNSKMKGKGYQHRSVTAGPSQVGGNFILTGNDSPLELTLIILGKKFHCFFMLTEGWYVTKRKKGSLRAAGGLVKNSQGLIDTMKKTPLLA